MHKALWARLLAALEGQVPETALESWLRPCRLIALDGDHLRVGAPNAFTRDWVEGPTAIQIGDEFLVYYDGYTAHRYEAKRSKDLKSWEDVSSKIEFPKGTRHGTAITVPMELIQQLQTMKGKP